MSKIMITLLLVLVLLKKAAQQLLERAQVAYQTGRLEEAIQLADSIGVLYPKVYEVRHAANRLGYDITKSQLLRDVNFIDSVLSVKRPELEAILPRFTYERDTVYQQTGRYLWPTQVIEKNTSRSYLRFQTEENGKMSLRNANVTRQL